MAAMNQVFEFLAAVMKNVPWGKVAENDLQKWINDPKRLATELLKFLKNFPQDDEVAEQKPEPILRRLYEDETIALAARDGSRFISAAASTFPSGIDRDFTGWGLNKRGSSTPVMNVSVHEMVKDATLVQMFGSLNPDLDGLCFSQDQIIEFCEQHRSKLREDGYATLFLFKEGDQFYVAVVGVGTDGLRVDVRRLGHDYVWIARYARRVVVPQLTA